MTLGAGLEGLIEICLAGVRAACDHLSVAGKTLSISPKTITLQHLMFWTIMMGHRNVKITSQKLSWNPFLAP